MQSVTPGGTRGGGNYARRLIDPRNNTRRVIQDECDQPVSSLHEADDSSLPACDAAAAARDRPVNLCADHETESSQPLLCTDQDNLEGVAGSQVGHPAGGKDNEQGQEQESLCDGLTHRETDFATACNGRLVRDDEERGAKGVGRGEDEVETDEELAEGTLGKAREDKEEEEVETDEEVETRTGNRTGDREQILGKEGQEENEDADEEGKGANKRAGDVGGSSAGAMPSTPPVNRTLSQDKQGEIRSKEGRPKEPNGDRASAENQQNDKYNCKAGMSSSVTEQERIHSSAGGGQAEFATPIPVLRVPPTIQVRGPFPRKRRDGV